MPCSVLGYWGFNGVDGTEEVELSLMGKLDK